VPPPPTTLPFAGEEEAAGAALGERRERLLSREEKREKEKGKMNEKWVYHPFIPLPNRPKVRGSNPTHLLQAQRASPP